MEVRDTPYLTSYSNAHKFFNTIVILYKSTSGFNILKSNKRQWK